jgi:large repetitive protein
VQFVDDLIGGGRAGPDCPTSGPFAGCGGVGGDGGTFAVTDGTAGNNGPNGKSGTATEADTNAKIIALPAMRVTTAHLADAKAGHAFRATLTASGEIAPYAWKISGLPMGLKLAATTGKITGKPAKAGSYNLAIAVTDPSAAKPSTGKRTLSLIVTR